MEIQYQIKGEKSEPFFMNGSLKFHLSRIFPGNENFYSFFIFIFPFWE